MSDLNYKLFLELDGDLRTGRLCSLLTAVDSLGSLSRAAAQLKVSYRHAWGLVKQAEERLGAPLLEKRVGGAEGGGAVLTAAARELLTRYGQVRRQVGTLLEAPPPAPVRPLLLATTIGPAESGLVGALEEAYYGATGNRVRHIAAGTGQALEIARAGRADLVLTHAPDLEQAFLADDCGADRIPLMFNDFLLLGPVGDPAEAGTAPGAAESLRRVAEANASFVSRGDRSGTHVKELALWQAAGISPTGPWYTVSPRGSMGSLAALRDAEERQAYILVDRAAYLGARQAGLNLAPLLQGDPVLRNEFALLTVNPERFGDVQYEGALHFARWAAGEQGQALIRHFGTDRYGEPLFFPIGSIGY